MIHTRKQIIQNQAEFREEIMKWLRKEYKTLSKELNNIETKSKDKNIEKEKKAMLDKLKIFNYNKFMKGTESLFIGHKNIFPNIYIWWNENTQEVIKYKYDK